MRLLDTTTYRLKTFIDLSTVPDYAILSHRWREGEEIPFGDLQDSYSHLSGYQKVRAFCDLARNKQLDYAWADTCCIDSRSSAELSEAINSMFQWYQDAKICIVYLSDVHSQDDLSKSEWFQRGWTLQELIAPNDVHFFSRSWDLLGKKSQLRSNLERITGIPCEALENFDQKDYCLAQKLSWAAERKTTRVEDRAYCLLGILGVNIGMLYGEGTKAFQRLQEEIMRASADTSLFMWQGAPCPNFGLLASDVSCFNKNGVTLNRWGFLRRAHDFRHPGGWTCSNAGIHLRRATLYCYGLDNDGNSLLMLPLGLYDEDASRSCFKKRPFIVLRPCPRENEPGDSYERVTIYGRNWQWHVMSMDYFSFRNDRQTVSNLTISRQPSLPNCTISEDWSSRIEISLCHGRSNLYSVSWECHVFSDPRVFNFGQTPWLPRKITEREGLGYSGKQDKWTITSELEQLRCWQCVGYVTASIFCVGNVVRSIIFFGYGWGLTPMALIVTGAEVVITADESAEDLHRAFEDLEEIKVSGLKHPHWRDADVGVWTKRLRSRHWHNGVGISSSWNALTRAHNIEIDMDTAVLVGHEVSIDKTHPGRREARKGLFEGPRIVSL